jgi:POT family proton-dependent oligopeptide transporter
MTDREPGPAGGVSTTRGGAVGFSGHPAGLSGLYFTELWERFSYYGMRALLTLFMVAPIAEGGLGFATAEAGRIYGNYTMAVYMLSIPGGFIADRILGARRSVLWGGCTIAAGHYALAVPTLATFYLGLILIALGTGLFKPNISALVGALYARDDERRDAGFSIFYMGINIGAFIAPLVTGFLAQSATFKTWLANAGFDPAQSWHWGFAAAGVGMTLAMMSFVRTSRNLQEPDHHLGPRAETTGRGARVRQTALVIAGTLALLILGVASDIDGLTGLRWLFLAAPLGVLALALNSGTEDGRRIAAIAILFIAAMIFWAIFEQAGTTIALFADRLTDTQLFGMAFPSSWFQSINPIFVILLAPLFAMLWLRLAGRQPSPAVKFALGLAFLSLSFALMVPAAQLTAAGKVSPLWLVGLFFLQTIGDLLLSPVGLSAMTRLAPARATGLVLGVWFLAAAWGNKLAGVMGGEFTSDAPDALAGFFLTQALWVGLAAALLFGVSPWVKKLSQSAH